MNANLMNVAIAADLTASGATSVADTTSSTLTSMAVFDGEVNDLGETLSPVAFYSGTCSTGQGWGCSFATGNNFQAWDEFTVVETPEPDTALLTLSGLGLLGLTLAMRKRKAHDLAQAT